MRPAKGEAQMAKYIPRTCPQCRDYLAVIVSPWLTNDREYDVNGFCAVCGYEGE